MSNKDNNKTIKSSKTKKGPLEKNIEKTIIKREEKKRILDNSNNQEKFGNRVYIYCRVSTNQQQDEGESLNNQETKCREFCSKNNLEVISVKQECISGTKPWKERPCLKDIISLLLKKKGNGLVIYKLDRLGRNLLDILDLVQIFQKEKLGFFEVSMGLQINTPIGQLMIQFLGSLAQFEASLIKERTNSVIQYRKENGLPIGGLQFGFDSIRSDDSDITFLVKNEDEQQTISIIQELREELIMVNGKQKVRSFKKIADELMRQGRKNKAGKVSWQASQIQRIYKTLDKVKKRIYNKVEDGKVVIGSLSSIENEEKEVEDEKVE